MTRSHGFTKRSPAQIRQQAATALRNRARGIFPVTLPAYAPELRRPEPDETPLSAAEVRFGRAHGLIQSTRAIAQGSTR